MKWLDAWLNRITMYRLVLYVLIGLLLIAAGFGQFGFLSYSGIAIAGSAILIVGLAWLTNRIFAWAFNAPVHDSSAYITGCILALIITPYRGPADLGILMWAPILAMAGKYILAFRRQHVANPAALAVVITSLALHTSASWWVGTPVMTIPMAVGGFLIIQKIRRWDVVLMFLGTSVAGIAISAMTRSSSPMTAINHALTSSAIIFFATVMLAEPSTMPPTRRLRLMFGAFVGILYVPQVHVGNIYFAPELALVIGNLIGWMIARRVRYQMVLQRKIEQSPTVMDFVFSTVGEPRWQPGQYLEWIVPHHSDNRGPRRYFTIASSPTEKNFRIGVKFYSPMSRYKEELLALKPGQTIVASQMDGDFTLPREPQQKLLFLAGGIGVTPFRSMVKFLIDRKERRNIVLIFAVAKPSDIVYDDIFEQARVELGMETIYIVSDVNSIPADWTGERGMVSAEMIQRRIPDYAERLAYLSGPQGMVTTYVKILQSLGLPRRKIKTDYFPGFA